VSVGESMVPRCFVHVYKGPLSTYCVYMYIVRTLYTLTVWSPPRSTGSLFFLHPKKCNARDRVSKFSEILVEPPHFIFPQHPTKIERLSRSEERSNSKLLLFRTIKPQTSHSLRTYPRCFSACLSTNQRRFRRSSKTCARDCRTQTFCAHPSSSCMEMRPKRRLLKESTSWDVSPTSTMRATCRCLSAWCLSSSSLLPHPHPHTSSSGMRPTQEATIRSSRSYIQGIRHTTLNPPSLYHICHKLHLFIKPSH
jgi:hypothetical protein